MSLKNSDLLVDEHEPFKHCRLNRKQYADMLTQLVKNYKDGFVMSLNNKWGTGKSTFLGMWQQQLKNEGFETILFNAWENDFENNPLAALLGELSVLADSDNPTFKEVLSTASIFLKNVVPAVAYGVAEKYLGDKAMSELAKAGAKAFTQLFEKDVKEYTEKKKGIKDFKIILEQFVRENCNGKPLIFMIDELDRCRPNYAVSVLEQIKHFFSVPGIVFILSIDKEQLSHAVKGVYNSDNIDTADYLRRFIDLEYSIPEPDPKDSINYYYGEMEFDNFFNSPYRTKIYGEDEGEVFKKMSQILLGNFTLRQQQKILSSCRVALTIFELEKAVIPSLLIFLVFLKHTDNKVYDRICKGETNIKELNTVFRQNMISKYDSNQVLVASLEFFFYYFSYQSLPDHNSRPFFIYNFDGYPDFVMSSTVGANFRDFMQLITNSVFNLQTLDIKYFTNKINLTSRIN